MKVLVFAHELEVGGTQVNAIELAASFRDQCGHEVVFFATPGPMVELVKEKQLNFVPAPSPIIHPSPARIRALWSLIVRERPDVIHVWDWWQCLDAYLIHLLTGIPMVATVMSMDVPRPLPRAMHTTFGTPELLDEARTVGFRRLELVLPPVDIHHNAPGVVDPSGFRTKYGVDSRCTTIVTVSRLDVWMKAESLRRTIQAVRALGNEMPIQFVIVGDGAGRPAIEQLAKETNDELGRNAIILTGALLDPRPAYAAADIVVGMGGSSLKALAFGKPLIVVGDRGFSEPFTPETADLFHFQGMYGRGDGNPDNSKHVADLRRFANARETFPELGALGRKFVLEHFSLERVSARLSEFFRTAISERRHFGAATADGFRIALMCLRERRLFADNVRSDVRRWFSALWPRGGKKCTNAQVA